MNAAISNAERRYHVTAVLPVRDERAIGEIEALCFARALAPSDYAVLSEARAIDFEASFAQDGTAVQAEILTLAQELGLRADFAIRPKGAPRKKRLLICDMDSTLIGQECIDELADFAGVGAYVAGITERAMRGEIGFEDALIERVGLLKGLQLDVLQTCYEERIRLNPGARTLARTMAMHGAKTVIVSGGFTFFSARIAKAAGFAVHQANILRSDTKALLGEVEMPILGKEAKKAALITHSAGEPGNAVAIGDGANDLAMITAAGLGIAYRAKPAVAAAAHCAIMHTDLTSALYFQGFSDKDFALD